MPARRAVTWQMSDAAGTPVVRERYWLTFQPGEVRVCTSCHGLSSRDQMGRPEPVNAPEALRQVVRYYRDVLSPASSPVASSFFTLTPCRLLDTRGAAGPFGAPALPAFGQGATRANNAQVKLAANGSIGISNDAGGAVHVILDVFGYYR